MGGRGNKGKIDRERREGEDNQMNKPVQSSEPEAKRLGSCGLYTTDHTRLLCSWRVHYKPHSYGKCVFNMQLCGGGGGERAPGLHLHLITVATSLHLYIVYW